MEEKKRGKLETVVLAVAAVIAVAAAALLVLFYTKPGKKLTSKVVANYLHGSVNYVSGEKTESGGNNGEVTFEKPEEIKQEDGEKEFYHILLLGEESEKISSRELEYCIRESMENLRLGQVFTSFSCSCEGNIPLKYIVSVYDFYENMVEYLLDDLTAMLVNLSCANGNVHMNIQLGCTEDIAQQALSDVTVPYGSFTYDIADTDVVIDLVISEGGDGKC